MAPAKWEEEMFANLVESSSHKGDFARSGKFFLATLSIYALAFLAIGVGSIYAYNAQFNNNNLELTSLVTPVESEVQILHLRPAAARPANAPSSSSNVAVVKSPPVMTTTDPTVTTHGVSEPPTRLELPIGTNVRIGNPGPNDNIFGDSGNRGGSGGNSASGNGTKMDELVRETPPPPIKVEPAKSVKPTIIRSTGPINGKAVYLPKPAFTAIAKAAHAYGPVNVEVLIDESGKVVSAHAVNGHPLLVGESVRAAYQARFSPTILGGQPVKVSGVITYNFVMQ
jgi:protein TonB